MHFVYKSLKTKDNWKLNPFTICRHSTFTNSIWLSDYFFSPSSFFFMLFWCSCWFQMNGTNAQCNDHNNNNLTENDFQKNYIFDGTKKLFYRCFKIDHFNENENLLTVHVFFHFINASISLSISWLSTLDIFTHNVE